MNVFKLRKQPLKTLKILPDSLNRFDWDFPVEPYLKAQVHLGDSEALFQVGLRALIARQFDTARRIFQEAKEKRHPLADIYLDIASRQLTESSLNAPLLTPHESVER